MTGPRRLAVSWLALLTLTSVSGVAAPKPPPRPELLALFRPAETTQMALSIDGRHVAYTERRNGTLILVIRDLEKNTVVRVPLTEDKAEELSGAREKTPAQLSFLRWAAGGRLVFNLNSRNIWSIRADGSDERGLVNSRDFRPPEKIILPPTFYDAPLPPPPPAPSPSVVMGADYNQPLRVVALPRGDNHVYVEALALDRMSGFTMDRTVIPRVVVRIDVDTGKREDWGESTPKATNLLTDQQGHPRLALFQPRIGQSSHYQQIYQPPDNRSDWVPLDKVAKEFAGKLDISPEIIWGERAIPIAFDYNPSILYIASNIGRDTYGIYGLDVTTGKRTDVAIESEVADMIAAPPSPSRPFSPLVFDPWREKLVGIRYVGVEPATVWFDRQLSTLQQKLERTLPGRRVEIVDWNEQRERLLVSAWGPSQPSVFYIFYPAENRLDEFFNSAPWIDETITHPSGSIAFRSTAGVDITGYLTLPRRPRLKRPPLIVFVRHEPGSRERGTFVPEVQALAGAGFTVLEINYRGSGGFGRKHLLALRGAPDQVPVDDLLAGIDWVVKFGRIDPRLVAIVGRGYGGYLALRAVQLHPDRFRCAVAWSAPVDLRTWVNPSTAPFSFFGEMRRQLVNLDEAKLAALSPITEPEKINCPVMIIERDSDTRNRGAALHRALKKLGRDSTLLQLDADAATLLPKARAEQISEIEGFLNFNIYNYAVKLGAPEAKPDDEPLDLKPIIERPELNGPGTDVPPIALPPSAGLPAPEN